MSFFKKKPETLVKTTLERIKICKNKKSTLARQFRNDAAQLLRKAQYDKAMARVELVCKEENMVVTYELLDGYCQLFLQRVDRLRSGKECPADLKGVIATILYAAPRCGDLPELQEIRSFLRSMYGDQFCNTAVNMESSSNLVDRKIVGSLSTQPPNQETKINLLKEIAIEHQITLNPAVLMAANFGATSMTKTKTPSNLSHQPKDTLTPASTPTSTSASTPAPVPVPAPTPTLAPTPALTPTLAQASDHRAHVHELAVEGSKDNHGNARVQVKPITSDKSEEEQSAVRGEVSKKASMKPSTRLDVESSIPAKGMNNAEHEKPTTLKKDEEQDHEARIGTDSLQRDDRHKIISSTRYNKVTDHDVDKEMFHRRGSGQSSHRVRLELQKELADQLKVAAEEAFRSAAEAEKAAGVAEAAVMRASPRTRASKDHSYPPNSSSNIVAKVDWGNVDHRKPEERSSKESHILLGDVPSTRHEYTQMVSKPMKNTSETSSSRLLIKTDEERDNTRFRRNSRENSGNRINVYQNHEDVYHKEEVKHVVHNDDFHRNLPKFDESKEEEIPSKPSFYIPHTNNNAKKFREVPTSISNSAHKDVPKFDDSDGEKDIVGEPYDPNLYARSANPVKHVRRDPPKYHHISSDKTSRPYSISEPYNDYDDSDDFHSDVEEEKPANHINAQKNTRYGIPSRVNAMPISDTDGKSLGMKPASVIKMLDASVEDQGWDKKIRNLGASNYDLDFDDEYEHSSRFSSGSNIRKSAHGTKLPTDKYGHVIDVKPHVRNVNNQKQVTRLSKYEYEPHHSRLPPLVNPTELNKNVEVGKEEEEAAIYARKGPIRSAKKVTSVGIDEDEDERSSYQLHHGGYQSAIHKTTSVQPSQLEYIPSKPGLNLVYGSGRERRKQNARYPEDELNTRIPRRAGGVMSDVKSVELGAIGTHKLRWTSSASTSRSNMSLDDDDDDEEEEEEEEEEDEDDDDEEEHVHTRQMPSAIPSTLMSSREGQNNPGVVASRRSVNSHSNTIYKTQGRYS